MLAQRPEQSLSRTPAGLGPTWIHQPRCRPWAGSLRPLPTGRLMGLPGDLRALAASRTLSLRGLARIPLDVPAALGGAASPSAGSSRPGCQRREVVDHRLVELNAGTLMGFGCHRRSCWVRSGQH
jgi:oxygen-dependent protoporphyrinogen oxidase